jgi:hypothetical protein
VPFGEGWTGTRDLPAPSKRSFHALYRRNYRGGGYGGGGYGRDRR